MKKILLYSSIAVISLSGSFFAFADDNTHTKGKHYKGKKFEKMDTNSDGIVTKEEFMAEAEKRFAKLDLNNDGTVTKEESENSHKNMKKKWKERIENKKEEATQ